MGILNSILQMSLAGSVLFLIICIFKPFTRKTFTATWNYYMLVITLMVFIIPVGSLIKLPQITNYKSYIPIENSSKVLNLNKANILQEDENNNKKISDGNDNETTNVSDNQNNLEKSIIMPQLLKKEMLLYIWMLGVIIFIGKEAYVYASFIKSLIA